jgi:hypothetical protein
MKEQMPWPMTFSDIFANTAEARDVAKTQAERFWKAQSKILDNFESLSKSWLDRRRQGTKEALEASVKMFECKDASEFNACCNEWMSSSIDRWIADGRALGEQSILALQQTIEVMEEANKPAKAVKKAKAAGPAKAVAKEQGAAVVRPPVAARAAK